MTSLHIHSINVIMINGADMVKICLICLRHFSHIDLSRKGYVKLFKRDEHEGGPQGIVPS